MQQFLPVQRIPGFAFHQTERTDDNGTAPCTMDTDICYDMNARDFDYLGYKYSLLSSIGTAGLNNVVCMIPARDEEEYTLFPQDDLRFISEWLAWTDANKKFLERCRPISTLPPPSLGSVDGTCAMFENNGFLFLFNPNLTPMTVQLNADESMCIDNSTLPLQWQVQMIYPHQLVLPPVRSGDVFSVNIPGASAAVLQLNLQADTHDTFSSTTINVLGAEYTSFNATVHDDHLTVNIEGLRVSLLVCASGVHDTRFRSRPTSLRRYPCSCLMN